MGRRERGEGRGEEEMKKEGDKYREEEDESRKERWGEEIEVGGKGEV